MTFLRYVFVFITVILLCSCNSLKVCVAEEFMQGTLADGMARIAVQPMSMIVNELQKKDNEKGFFGPYAKLKVIKDPDPNSVGKGKAIITLENVIFKHDGKKVYEDCKNEEATWYGQAHIIKATLEMSGYLTNDAKEPVVPEPNSIKITVNAKATDLKILFKSRKESVKVNGTLSYSVIPRLAQSNKHKMRTVATNNSRFENIKLSLNAKLKSPDIKINIPIKSSDYYIQIGEGENGESNKIAGDIEIFDQPPRKVPYDKKGMDPDYDYASFLQTFNCHEELRNGISYEHVSFEEVMTPLYAGMTSVLAGETAKKLEENSECGFASPKTLANADFIDKNKAKLLLKNCEITFENHHSTPNQFGEFYILNGQTNVDAVQKLTGLVTYTKYDLNSTVEKYAQLLANDPKKAEKKAASLKPVIPTSTDNYIKININLVNFDVEIKAQCDPTKGVNTDPRHCSQQKEWLEKRAITVKLNSKPESNSYLQVVLKPILAKDKDKYSSTFNMCVKPTSKAHVKTNYNNVYFSFSPANSVKRFYFLLNGVLNLWSGEHSNGIENKLTSTNFMVGNNALDLVNSIPLDPNYDRKNFKDSYLLKTKIAEVSNEECNLEENFKLNIARMLVLNAGALTAYAAKQIKNNISSNINESLSSKIKNENGIDVEEFYCELPSINKEQNIENEFKFKSLDASNSSVSMSVSGKKDAKFNENATGLGKIKNFGNLAFNYVGDKSYFRVIPSKNNGIKFNIFAHINNFMAEKISVDDESPILKIEEGKVNIEAIPLMASLDKNTDNKSYTIKTNHIKFKDVIFTHTKAYFLYNGMRIPLIIHEAKLTAKNGHSNGNGNYVLGTIKYNIINDLSIKYSADHAVQTIIKSSPLVPTLRKNIKSYGK